MLDDMCDFELKEIVEDIDKKGYSEHYFTPGYERTIKYDYRKFNIKNNNALLKGLVLEIKNGYEGGEQMAEITAIRSINVNKENIKIEFTYLA